MSERPESWNDELTCLKRGHWTSAENAQILVNKKCLQLTRWEGGGSSGMDHQLPNLISISRIFPSALLLRLHLLTVFH
ncbi:hypothetical protein SNEBB_008324 [Seison nebaliae]|nr:hypothetical protein SNEBB_008324 [Seison nebaliae]